MKIIESDPFWDVVQCRNCKSTTTIQHPAGDQYFCCWCETVRHARKITLRTSQLKRWKPSAIIGRKGG